MCSYSTASRSESALLLGLRVARGRGTSRHIWGVPATATADACLTSAHARKPTESAGSGVTHSPLSKSSLSKFRFAISPLANFQVLLTRCAGMGADKRVLEDPFGLPRRETVPDVPVGAPAQVQVVEIDQDDGGSVSEEEAPPPPPRARESDEYGPVSIHIPGAAGGAGGGKGGKEKKKKKTLTKEEKAANAAKKKHEKIMRAVYKDSLEDSQTLSRKKCWGDDNYRVVINTVEDIKAAMDACDKAALVLDTEDDIINNPAASPAYMAHMTVRNPIILDLLKKIDKYAKKMPEDAVFTRLDAEN